MAKKNVRVGIPTDSPDKMITLAERITEKHESYTVHVEDNPRNDMEDEEFSPLVHKGMLGFKQKTALGKRTLCSARKKETDAQGLMQEAHTIIGIAQGQTSETKGTLYFSIDQFRSVLLGEHQGNEQELQKYGFNVVISETHGRKTIRTELSINSPQKTITLCKNIITQYDVMGPQSILSQYNIVEFKDKTASASQKLTASHKLHSDAQAETEKAYQIIGIGKGQNLQSEGTLYQLINNFKTTLLGEYKGREEQLERWGFNVVITETMPGRKSKRLNIIHKEVKKNEE